MFEKDKYFGNTSLIVYIAKSDMFNSGAPQFTAQTKYIRNAKMDTTTFAAPEVWHSTSVSCAASFVFRNGFAATKASIYTIHGNNSLA